LNIDDIDAKGISEMINNIFPTVEEAAENSRQAMCVLPSADELFEDNGEGVLK
jgi:hypothetical protein